MKSMTRKRIGPLALMPLAILGVVAVVVALSAMVPQTTQAQTTATDCAAITDPIEQAQCNTCQSGGDVWNTNTQMCDAPAGTTPPPPSTPTPTSTPTSTPQTESGNFMANAAADRAVELQWPGVADATGYEIRYRNLDTGAAWSDTISVAAGTHMYTLEDDDLADGALYEVQLRTVGETWEEGDNLLVLGPVIQFSVAALIEESTGEPISEQLPKADLVKGDTVRYSIKPSLPEGLSYGGHGTSGVTSGEVELPLDEHLYIMGAVGHRAGGSNLYYRLKGCDEENNCATHIFRINIEPATVKPLADVIRDREYVIDEALSASHPLNQFPQVGMDSDTAYEYQLLLTENYQPLNLPGLTFDPETRRLSGTPTLAAKGEYRVTYRANTATSNVFHEAEFTIKIVEIETHVCRTGLNYEETLEVYNTEDTVGSANFTVRATSDLYYVLPIGEKGQRGAGQARTRTFELITVEKGGDLAAPDADMLPDGLQVVSFQVDEASRNPVTNDDPEKWLYTRQGFYDPAGQPAAQTLMDGRYADPEPDYPATDEGNRLAIGVSNASALREGAYQSCFIVHDTDDDTGETDSSAVVFNLNVLPDLSARDWVIELTTDRTTSELDVDEAFTTSPALLNFEAMYVDEFAARATGTGCIADAAADPKDIVTWTTNNDKVIFTAKEVTQTETQRVQVKASLKTGGSEACVQVRITVLHPDDEQVDPPSEPTALTAPTDVTANGGSGTVSVTWTDGENAVGHLVMLLDANFNVVQIEDAPTGNATVFSGLSAGSYTAVVVAYKSVSDYEYAHHIATVN